jgi:rubrerythrin
MKMGWKLAGGMPKNSKVYDYKELWKGKKSAMNENMSEQEALKQIRPLLAHTIEHNKLPETFDELLIKIKNGDDDILDQMWDLAGSAIDKHAINVLSKPKNMNETLRKLIEQELLNEVTYSKFKKEVKHRTKSEQLHKAIREVKRKLQEIDRIVEYTSRMKQELSEDEGGILYWKATQNNIGKISEMVSHLNNKIKNLHQ